MKQVEEVPFTARIPSASPQDLLIFLFNKRRAGLQFRTWAGNEI